MNVLSTHLHLPLNPTAHLEEAPLEHPMPTTRRTPPWKKPNPQRSHESLTPASKAAAKARATRAGRTYPNLIDNMHAAMQQKKRRSA
jgi:hypothetical protein